MTTQASTTSIPRPAPTPVVKTRRRRQWRFLVAAIVVLGAIGYLITSTMRDTTMYYLTVPELLARGEAAYGEQVRLGGRAQPGSIQSEPKTMTLRFVVAEGDGPSLPVIYKGVVPDAFKADAEVVLEGKLTPEGVFMATTLLAKCPSKYEPES